MNTVNEESKSAAIKTLAIIGFVAAIVIGLWIAVTVIRFIPGAFSSLASITDSLYGTGAGLVIKAEKDVVNSGDALRLAWTPVRSEGTYIFSYRCADGISAEARNAEGDITRIPCEEDFILAEGALTRTEQTTEIIFRSEKQRFTDVAYTVSFVKEGEEEAAYERTGVATIVNATIPSGIAVGTDRDTTDRTPVVRPTPKPTPVVTPKPTPTPSTTSPKPAPVYYTTVPVTTTSFPVSNPNGQIDLEVTLLGIGEIKNGTFVPLAEIDNDDKVAMRFTVKNIGTKTSGDWNYAASFPGEGDDSITSSKQAPLLPGERATITLTFTSQEDDGTETARVSISTAGDVKSTNNTASKSVRIDN